MKTLLTCITLYLAFIHQPGPPRTLDEARFFPDGREYDFGLIVRGHWLITHHFPIVNPTRAPMTLQLHVSCAQFRYDARLTKEVLQPGEQGLLVITCQPGRVPAGRRSTNVTVDLSCPEFKQTYCFTISAELTDDPDRGAIVLP